MKHRCRVRRKRRRIRRVRYIPETKEEEMIDISSLGGDEKK
jgi:hypothetical protein